MVLSSHRQPNPFPDTIIARDEDRFFSEDMAQDTGRSNFAAFLLGGVVVAGGMLAFLYYDADSPGRGQDITTGSLGRIGIHEAAPNVLIPPQRPRPSSTP